MVGMFVCSCLASQKPSEQEFSIPARMDLGVKLLMDGEAKIRKISSGEHIPFVM